jgi:short-subunit dehydrogenase
VIVRDKVVIVTGASAGIGRAAARQLAREGAHVVITARRASRLHQLADELATRPGRRLVVAGDIQDERFASQLARRTMAEFGRIDVLVNNAGLGHRSYLTTMPAADMRAIIDTNLMGMLYLTQAVVPHMKQQGGGQIINVSSIASQRPFPRMALYGASKSAVNFVSRGLRLELHPYNIKVTLIYPGRTLTEFGDARLGDKGSHPSPIARVPADRVGRVIVKAIRSGKTELYVTWYDWLFAQLNRLFPRATDYLAGQAVRLLRA